MDFIEGVQVESLKTFHTSGGKVMRGIRKEEIQKNSFGEAYFTSINAYTIRGWKLHTRMTSRIIVPYGNVKFVLYDNRQDSFTYKKFQVIILGDNNYSKLILPSNIWFAFQGINMVNIIFNLSDLVHDPNESLTMDLVKIDYNWKIKKH